MVPGRLKLGARALALALAGILVLFAVLVWRLTHRTPPPKAGVDAPTFVLQRLDGHGLLSLSSLRGKTVVLNFWASYCEPCKEEAPVGISTLPATYVIDREGRLVGSQFLGPVSDNATDFQNNLQTALQ